MEKLYCVKLELHNKLHTSFVKATSELDAILQARTIIKDTNNIAHVIYVARA